MTKLEQALDSLLEIKELCLEIHTMVPRGTFQSSITALVRNLIETQIILCEIIIEKDDCTEKENM